MAWIAFLAVAAPCVVLAVRIEVLPQPVSPFADTEVTTNISFGAANGHVRYLELAFALDGCASNCVQVAFGHDANGDGVLGFAAAKSSAAPTCRSGTGGRTCRR